MSAASSPSDPNASDNLPNIAYLAIMIFRRPETSSNPASNNPSSSNASPCGSCRTETVRRRTRSTQDADIPANRPNSPGADRSPGHIDPSSSSEFDEDSDASGSVDDSDDSSPDSSLFYS
ncbi:hypothetical protein Dimus_018039 [Dionaea muscipula]